MNKTEKEVPARLPIAGYPVRALTSTSLADMLFCNATQRVLFFVNTNFVVKCQTLREQMLTDSVVLVNDGIGMDLASYCVHGRSYPENLNGTDFVPFLLQQSSQRSAKPWRVFLYGGKPGVGERAASSLSKLGADVCGFRDGYGSSSAEIVEAVNRAEADVLLVAMGNPLQEQWILQHRAQLKVRLLIGVGALLDFIAGDKPRAPAVVQKLRLEWLYRLSLEPKRLLRRYSWDIAVFSKLCYRHRQEESFKLDSGSEI